MIDQNVLPSLVNLRFYLASPNLWTAVLCLTSNASKNRKSNFLALGFFTVTDWLGSIGLLLVNPSGVETIAASKITLY